MNARWILSACLLPLVTGCLSTHKTVVRDETRVTVTFESDTAGRVFYEALSQKSQCNQQQESRTQFSIPVVLDVERTVVTGPNQAFNQAVARTDTNQDGVITESEARIFASTVK
jgi:hypothetical protein